VLSRTDVHEAIRHAVGMCQEEFDARGVTLRLRLDAEEPYVQGDATRLSQIFWNLLRNAAGSTPQGGMVRVVSRHVPDSGALRVEVSDTGRGIAAADMERIFQPFQQAADRDGGLGLGLAICRGLVEAHGGMIRARSEGPGRGAIFTVDLPRPALILEPDRVEPREQPPETHMRVLVVEDNRDTAEALSLLLRIHGFEVVTARTLREARRRVDEPIDVLISDIQLPDGSGLELMRELGSKTRGIAMSGFGAKEDMERSREAGFSAHLVKPVPIEKVLEAIQVVMAEQSGPFQGPAPL
jgi:CheY-like chemotaxis protein